MVIELPAYQEAQLTALAEGRDDKSVSRIIQDALDRYFAELADRREAVKGALATIGSFSEEEAAELEKDVLDMRAHWR